MSWNTRHFSSLFYGELDPSIWHLYSDLSKKLNNDDIILTKKWIENILYFNGKKTIGLVDNFGFRDLEYLYEIDIDQAKKRINDIFNKFNFIEIFKILKKWSKKNNKSIAFLKSSRNITKIYKELNEILILMSHEKVSVSIDDDEIFLKSYDGFWLKVKDANYTSYILKKNIGEKDPAILQGMDFCRYIFSMHVTEKGTLYINDYIKSENAKYLFDILRVLQINDIDREMVNDYNNVIIVKQLYEYLNLKAPLKLYVDDDDVLSRKLKQVFENEQSIQFYQNGIIFNFLPIQISNFLKYTYYYDSMLEEILLKGVYGYNVEYIWKNIIDKEELKKSFNLLNNVQVELLREKYISFYTIFEAIEISLDLDNEIKKLEYLLYNHFDIYYNTATQRCEIDLLKHCKFIIQHDELNVSNGWKILDRFYSVHNKEQFNTIHNKLNTNFTIIPDRLTLTQNLVKLISNQTNINQIVDEFNVVKL